MPALDVSNPKAISFLLENYEKETRLRIKWVQRHAGNIEKAAILSREEKNFTSEDILKSVTEAGMATITRDHFTGARHRKTVAIPDYLLPKIVATKDTEAIMKPVKQELKDSLRESRLDYLRKRSSLNPEDKYSFAECSNWMYGWKLGESGLRMSGPAHGQVHHVVRSQRTRVGLQRDPEHYSSPDTGHTLFVTV